MHRSTPILSRLLHESGVGLLIDLPTVAESEADRAFRAALDRRKRLSQRPRKAGKLEHEHSFWR
jgi:hypothetical protein